MARAAPRLLPLLCLALAACGANHPDANGYIGGTVRAECAPFARALTGVRLSGAAADWWERADGRYERTSSPGVGSVLVFRRSSRLPDGHVAVVSKVLSQRQITVTQANWVHHRVTEDQAVIDTSTANDWSEVRVWWPPTGQMGTSQYPTFGFIRPDHPIDHGNIVQRTPEAIRIAETGW
jgi:surface antigen